MRSGKKRYSKCTESVEAVRIFQSARRGEDVRIGLYLVRAILSCLLARRAWNFNQGCLYLSGIVQNSQTI